MFPICLALAWVCAGPVAQAQQDNARGFKTEIVVTPERGETPRASVPVAVSVLDAAAIQALPAVHVSELMPFIAGFVTARSEFHAGRPIVSARGFFGGGEAEYLILLVNGVPVGDVESGLIDWAAVPASSIARLEASRGPGSSMYGDSAVGGVVQILTTRTATGGQLMLAGGSFSTFTADGSYGRRRAGTSFDLAGAARTTAGAYFHSEARQYSGSATADGAFQDLVWRLSAATHVTARDDPGASRRDAQGAASLDQPSLFRFDMTERLAHSASFGMQHGSMPLRPQVRVYAGLRDEDSIRTILLLPELGDRYARAVSAAVAGASFDGEHRFALGREAGLRVGADLSRESLESAYNAVDATGVLGDVAAETEGHRVRIGAFASAAWEATNRVRLSAAIRWDGVDDRGFGDAPAGQRSARAWSPRAGVVVHVNEVGTITAFGQVSRAFKMPTIDQLFDVRPFPDFNGGALRISNPRLEPQRATNIEAGISGSGRLTWSAVAYRMTVENEIDFDVRTFSYGNIGRSRHDGIEFEAEGRWWSRLRPSVTYSWSRTVDAATGMQLKNVPRHVLGLGAAASLWAGIGVHARYGRTGGSYLDDGNALPIDGPSRLDLRVRRQTGRHLVFVDVYNATDDRYEEYGFTLSGLDGAGVPYAYLGAARAMRAGVRFSF